MPTSNPNPTPTRKRHPLLVGWPPGVWCAAAAGKVRGYALTQETYDRQCTTLRANSAGAKARGTLTRKGIPNGWGGLRDQVESIREEAKDEAWRMVNVIHRNSMEPDERLDADVLAELEAHTRPAITDAERFAIAAAFCISVILDRTQPTSMRTLAARTILPFLTPKPKKGGVTLTGGLDWLSALVAGEAGSAGSGELNKEAIEFGTPGA